MKTSLQGICSMLSEEAIVLTSYDDGTGTMTIGAGHTAAAGDPDPRSGMRISLTEAINIYRSDIAKVESEVAKAVHVSLSQNQFDALVSWHFNTGAISSATLTTRINAGDVDGAAAEFARWNKSKGKVLEGLITRRARETVMFANSEYGDPIVRVMDVKGGKEEHYTAAQIAALMGGAPPTEEEQSTEQLLANPASQLLPISRPKQPPEMTRKAFAKFFDLVPADGRANAVAILAVRGYYLNSMGKEAANDRGVYDDAMFVIEPDDVYSFNGNTDPGKFGRGIAKLKSHQAVRYRPGLHGFSRKDGPYPAFRQDSDCTVTRDETGDVTDDASHRFWINLHRGGVTTTSSLGCQTVPPNQWNEFKTLVDKLLKKHGQQTFYYLLIDQQDLPKEEPQMVSITQPVAVGGSTMANTAEAVTLVKSLPAGGVLSAADHTALTVALANADAARKVIAEALLQNAKLDPLASSSDPQLTPVNGALGKTIGTMLDGRKTAIGILGLLVTTILPIFFPQLAPIVRAAEPLLNAATSAAASTAQTDSLPRELVTAAYPVFAALTGWGLTGKVEKWVRAIRNSTAK
ncbi:glycoside hydrolase family protein [Rhizobium leguminosarum bv. viciae]|uniref:lysozyme n=1 Tax=Rhizobium leguminosarum TaxID=384 RepID=UPI001440F419|nr:lysozyme [Rhizobium leguminosarum]NKJ92817.1 glycoside hydrolase family protein [Rhizobium leguminosarum bv. viciae]NKK86672.1 glycoside hydrolase family protein [Rhizobium leguminosarum bv. viciae]